MCKEGLMPDSTLGYKVPKRLAHDECMQATGRTQ